MSNKIYRGAEKGGVWHFFFLFFWHRMFVWLAAGWRDRIYFVSTLIYLDKASLVNINERHIWANIYKAQTNTNYPTKLQVFQKDQHLAATLIR